MLFGRDSTWILSPWNNPEFPFWRGVRSVYKHPSLDLRTEVLLPEPFFDFVNLIRRRGDRRLPIRLLNAAGPPTRFSGLAGLSRNWPPLPLHLVRRVSGEITPYVDIAQTGPYGLKVSLFWFIPGMLLVLNYSIIICRHFAGKVRLEEKGY